MIRYRYRCQLYIGSVGAALTLLALFFSFTTSAAQQIDPEQATAIASIHELQLHDQRVSFTLHTPMVPLPADGILKQPGLDQQSSVLGLPSLPYYSTYVVLPPDSQPRVLVNQLDQEVTRSVYLPPAVQEIVDTPPLLGDSLLELSPNQSDYAPETAISAGIQPENLPAGWFPTDTVEISEPMMFRDVRIARISIYPVRYDARRQLLSVTQEIAVTVDFGRSGTEGVRVPAPSYGDQHLAAIEGSVINPEQIEEFRSLSEGMLVLDSSLPKGKDLFKIGVQQDGIYILTYEYLKDAGMQVDLIDPGTFEMLYRGHPVATDFNGDSDSAFEAGESLRFFGQSFHGSRLERQFITENIYWLWAGAQANAISSKPSLAGDPVTTFIANPTREPESIYFQGFTAYWPENEPDAWYWDWFKVGTVPLTRTYEVTLTNPVAGGVPAQFTAEFSSRDSHIADQYHTIAVSMNGHPNVASRSWWGESNINVSATVPSTNVVEGKNIFEVTAETAGISAQFALNRITVSYESSLTAIDDQLLFSDQAAGVRSYGVRGFSNSSQDNILAWDITDNYAPEAILTPTIAVSGSGPYTYTFGLEHTGNAEVIVTTLDNLREPVSIERYVAPNLDAAGGADWVAIAAKQFIPETERLAAHRADPVYGGHKTHVVDIADIINEFGYGLPIPAAIQDYLSHAMEAWEVKPTYVVLVGDTTLDPRHIKSDWLDQQYVPTDLVFVDRYNGQIPSDLTFATVIGSDNLPDLSVGRIAVETVDELTLAIDKITVFDKNQLLSLGWMQNMLFVADANDPLAGEFCLENQLIAQRLPPSLNKVQLCLDDYAGTGTQKAENLRYDLKTMVENAGVTMLTYRGHGAIHAWGGDPVIFDLNHATALDNRRPFVVVSGDCLDGHYAYPPYEGLGERLFNSWAPADNIYGAAAHWGSSGLGLSSDHTGILDGFYDGLFTAGLVALGDATNYAKLEYSLDPWHDPALMYSFNLQGDPAMQLMRPDIELTGQWQQAFAEPGDQVTMSLTIQNHGVYPARVTLKAKTLDGFSVSAITSTVNFTSTPVGDGTEIALQFGDATNEAGIPRNGQVSLTLVYDVAPDALLGPRSPSYIAEATGFDSWPGNESLSGKIAVLQRTVWLPMQNR